MLFCSSRSALHHSIMWSLNGLVRIFSSIFNDALARYSAQSVWNVLLAPLAAPQLPTSPTNVPVNCGLCGLSKLRRVELLQIKNHHLQHLHPMVAIQAPASPSNGTNLGTTPPPARRKQTPPPALPPSNGSNNQNCDDDDCQKGCVHPVFSQNADQLILLRSHSLRPRKVQSQGLVWHFYTVPRLLHEPALVSLTFRLGVLFSPCFFMVLSLRPPLFHRLHFLKFLNEKSFVLWNLKLFFFCFEMTFRCASKLSF